MIDGFGNWGNPRDSFIREGYIREIEKYLCELFDVDEFRISKLCCCCHWKTAKVKYNKKKSVVFSIAATKRVDLLLTET
jgi:hypothetical protein